MISFLPLLLSLLATDVTCSRTLTVPRSIERTVIRLGVGLAATYGDEARLPTVAQLMEGDLGPAKVHDAWLLVDGQRTGTAGGRIVRGLATLGLFVVDHARPGDAVELRYTLGYRGLSIARSVEITEGQIVSRASFPCALGPQGRCKAVWFSAVARESPQGTIITLVARVRVSTGLCPARSTSRLQVVNRLAGRLIVKQLDETLAQVEREGRTIAASGHDALAGLARNFIDHILQRWER